jgi:hypothetical protein
LAQLLLGVPSPQTSVLPTQLALRADGTFDNECCAPTAKRLPDNAHDCWRTARASNAQIVHACGFNDRKNRK